MKIKDEHDLLLSTTKKKEVKSETEKTIGKKAKLVVKRENKCEQESKYLIQTNY